MTEPRHDLRLSSGKVIRVCESCRFLAARVHVECMPKVCSYCAVDPCDLCRSAKKGRIDPLVNLDNLEVVVG